jgi:hypothetical protein
MRGYDTDVMFIAAIDRIRPCLALCDGASQSDRYAKLHL